MGKKEEKSPPPPRGHGVCVQNLSEETTQDELKTLFQPFGEIHSIKVMTTAEGKCRGFAFVNYATIDDANKAVKEMHEKDVGGKQINVALAEKKGKAEKEKEKKE